MLDARAVCSQEQGKQAHTERIEACRFPDVLVLVDAAHSLGQLEVSVPDLGADFWVANCHKWLCAPRGTAVMWVREDRQHLVQPLIISHGHGHGFTSDFIWDGAYRVTLTIVAGVPSDVPGHPDYCCPCTIGLIRSCVRGCRASVLCDCCKHAIADFYARMHLRSTTFHSHQALKRQTNPCWSSSTVIRLQKSAV